MGIHISKKLSLYSILFILTLNLYSSDFISIHSFSISYTEGWFLMSNIEDYDSIESAAITGANYLNIYNYDVTKNLGSGTFTEDQVKITIWIIPKNGFDNPYYNFSTDEYRLIDEKSILNNEGRTIKKVTGEFYSSFDEKWHDLNSAYIEFPAYFIKIVYYPSSTKFENNCDEIVKSLLFENENFE